MQMEPYSGWEDAEHRCTKCGWTGSGREAAHELFDALVQVDCPRCGARLFLVPLPTPGQTREAASRGDGRALADLAALDARSVFFAERELTLLTEAAALPDLDGEWLDFFLTSEESDGGGTWHLLAVGEPPLTGPGDPRILHAERAAFETIEPVYRMVGLLEERYGARFRYLNTRDAQVWLLGDDVGYGDLMRALDGHLPPDS